MELVQGQVPESSGFCAIEGIQMMTEVDPVGEGPHEDQERLSWTLSVLVLVSWAL